MPPGSVVVRVSHCAVHWVDCLMMAGQYQQAPPLPYTPGEEYSVPSTVMRSTSTGMEYSGTVVALTPGDPSTTDPDPLAPGDEVLISGLYAGPRSYGEYQKYGGFATFSVAPRAAVTRVPAQLTMAQAATLNGAYETAYHALVRRISSPTCSSKKHSSYF